MIARAAAGAGSGRQRVSSADRPGPGLSSKLVRQTQGLGGQIQSSQNGTPRMSGSGPKPRDARKMRSTANTAIIRVRGRRGRSRPASGGVQGHHPIKKVRPEPRRLKTGHRGDENT